MLQTSVRATPCTAAFRPVSKSKDLAPRTVASEIWCGGVATLLSSDEQDDGTAVAEATAATPAARAAAAPYVDLCPLMAAYQRGEAPAFELLYAALAPQLRRYLTALARDVGRAQDLLQETFLQMHRVRHTYDPSRRVEPWAFALARHVYLMDARSRWRRGRHEVAHEAELPELPVPADVATLPDDDRVRRALARLSRERYEVVLLHHLWGFSFAEIAGLLAISSGAARVRASRGMAELRELLTQDARETNS